MSNELDRATQALDVAFKNEIQMVGINQPELAATCLWFYRCVYQHFVDNLKAAIAAENSVSDVKTEIMYPFLGGYEIGDEVQYLGNKSKFCREGDTGRILSIDLNGDLWVKWSNPLRPNIPEGWCATPINVRKVPKELNPVSQTTGD